MGVLDVAGVTESLAPVVVIGAGPSGLFAAAELARHGVQARVVEREPEPPRQARATALQPGTLEILTQAGLMDEFLASSVHLGFARVFDPALNAMTEMTFAHTGSPWEFECSLPQWRTEEILADRLAELGGSVERGREVVAVTDHGDDLLVEVMRPDGTPEVIETGWVVGAGGARSVTRESMTGELVGETYPGTALVGDVRVSCALPRDGSALIASPEGYVLLAPLPGDRWITFIGDLHDDEADLLASDLSVRSVATCIQRRIPQSVQLTEIGWAATFRMHRRLAPRLAGDRRFLLGDAGHLSSPFGGEGLNSGLHDGHNLAWKLALEVRGNARPALVDSYGPERAGAARHVLETSDRLHTMVRSAVQAARDGVAAARLSRADAAALTQARAMLDFSYADGPLTAEYRGPGGQDRTWPAAGRRYADWLGLPGTAHHLLIAGNDPGNLPAFLDRWAGLVKVADGTGVFRPVTGSGPEVVLVRPDGHVGFVASRADAEAIDALSAHLETYLIPA